MVVLHCILFGNTNQGAPTRDQELPYVSTINWEIHFIVSKTAKVELLANRLNITFQHLLITLFHSFSLISTSRLQTYSERKL